ncbi:MAG: isoprenylcysteine carboxylmethyltransferase family protein [Nitrososphaerota archaeon]|nr:isoprenylcysteine carboxylmethyltransferase family protein [Nitrososphaerota archaeon]
MRNIRTEDRVEIALPAPVIFLGFLLLGFVISLFFPTRLSVPRSLLLTLGFVSIVAASVIGSLAIREMRKAGTSPDPSKPPSKLITEGPFSFTRNPIYLSFALGYVGLTLVFSLSWALPLLIVALILVDRRVVAFEERYLEGKFGIDYARYKSKTHRWL